MARKAIDKLREAEVAVARMHNAQTLHDYRWAFQACCSALMSASYRLENEIRVQLRATNRAALPEANEWIKSFKNQIAKDSLLAWIADSRHADIHGSGEIGIGGSTLYQHFASEDIEPGPPDAALALGSEGPYWVENVGSASERISPVRVRPGTKTAQARNETTIVCSNPPATHLGQDVAHLHPTALCQFGFLFMKQLLDQAILRWWPPPPNPSQ